MKISIKVVAVFLLMFCTEVAFSQVNKVEVKKDENGFRLMVDNNPFEVKGVVWSYTPIGETYSYNLWNKSDEYIQKVIDTDAELMKEMGVNAIRVFSEVPAKWIEYFYYQHNIFTIVNYTFGRYGVNVNGKWHSRTDYSDRYTREVIKEESIRVIKEYRNTPGVLMFLFGNENNYGLEWESDNIENLPVGQRMESRAGYLYSLYEEVLELARRIDHNHPSGIVNGDIQYLNIIEELVPSLKILGVNTYRGAEASDLFYKSIESLDVPVVFTEMGSDAFNTRTQTEDQYNQALYLKSQWNEIYNQSYGKGKSQNCIGAFVFEWMDEWWKNGLVEKLDEHAKVGTWTNGGYKFDAETGIPNMNEEWFGIVAQSETKKDGVNRRLPRASYYTLKDIWDLSIYDSSPEDVEAHFKGVEPLSYLALGESNVTKDEQKMDIISIDSITIDTSFSESFSSLDVDEASESDGELYTLPDMTERHSEELTLGFGFNPTENLTGDVSIKVRGNIEDSLFVDADADQEVVELYSASFEYNTNLFDINGYYHNGLSDWYLEGDYFNLMPESYDMDGMDYTGSKAPYGLMFTGHEMLEGLKIYAGPEIYYGARPQAIIKYNRNFHTNDLYYGFSGVVQQEFNVSDSDLTDDVDSNDEISQAASISGNISMAPFFDITLGGYFAGAELIGDTYSYTTDAPSGEGTSGTDYYLFEDAEITWADTFAGKIDLSTSVFRHTEIYGRYLYAGLVADTNAMIPQSGFFKADNGTGNRQEIDAGVKVSYGNISVDVVGRKIDPLVGPLMLGDRDPLTDPFYVYFNRETLEGEMVITYDPTGASWFHNWNAVDIEDAPIAASLSLLYQLYVGESDNGMYLSAEDGPMYIFADVMEEAENLWQAKVKIITNPFPEFKVAFNYYGGVDQGFGSDLVSDDDGTNRLTTFMGGGLQIKYKKLSFDSQFVKDGWAYEEELAWERNFNITYPWQWKLGLAYSFDNVKFAEADTKVGFFYECKTYDEYSNVDSGETYDMEIGVYSSINY